MPWRGVNVALAIAVSYALGAWAFSFCLLLAVSAVRGVDQGWLTTCLAAPVAVPLLTLRQPDLFMLVWLACVLLTSFVVYRVIRRIVAPREPRSAVRRWKLSVER